MSNSFGFGGNNAVLIFSAPEINSANPRTGIKLKWQSPELA